MDDSPLPQYSRKTTFRVKFTDIAANVGITVGGLGVILAVMGLILFIFLQVYPLFQPGDLGEIREPIKQADDKALIVHCDEYRRVGVRINESGQVVVFSLPTGETISEFKPDLLGDATISRAQISLRPMTTAKVDGVMDVPHYHLLLGTSDGRVLVGSVAYVTDFLRFEDEKNEPAELEALHLPSEDEFKAVDYLPDTTVYNDRLVEHLTTFGFYRTIHAVVSVDRAMEFKGDGKPIAAIHGQINKANAEEERKTCNLVVTGDGRTLLVREKTSMNMFTDEVEIEADVEDLTERIAGTPDYALVNERMLRLILANRDGMVHVFDWDQNRDRFDMKYPAFSVFAQQADQDENRPWRDIVNDAREDRGLDASSAPMELTAVDYLLGDQTVMFGDSRGGLQGWFAVPSENENAPKRLTRVRVHNPSGNAIMKIVPSPITKSFIAMDAEGSGRAINNTGSREFVNFDLEEGIEAGVFARKGDGIIVVTDNGEVHNWWLDAPHSDTSFTAMFGKVWYEDFEKPEYIWQTTSGTDDAEPKISLVPLISGTLKGALYALLFSVPLAVLAAIYTSEFMHRNLRTVFKPTMEVMASLPSVVLGFLAALYFAPKAAILMPTILTALFVIPGLFMAFGWLWQRCPPSFIGRFGHRSSTLLLFVLLGSGIFLSNMIGPRAEVFLFPAIEGANPALVDATTFDAVDAETATALSTGDFRSWTDGGRELPRATEVEGHVLPKGWWIPGGHNLLLVLMAIPLTLLTGLGVKRAMALKPKREGKGPIENLRDKLEGEYKGGLRAVAVDAVFSLGFALMLLGIGFLLSLAITPIIEYLFFSYDHPTAGRVADFRRWITGPDGWKYEQSNSVIVGFAMGFAVIPIIYTIAEDALNTVPNQLRAASLACGASRWQTTMRVVMPAAIAGIFSGIVIGLGRALGETMIVVMAAGGTPVTDMQPLSGFRSLSAAIAIEMPEAPHGGTLYRTLFLAGFLLFCMTFVINTLAEAVRIRLRRKLSRL
ncbi:MAG: ABC transporter permease subunit [Planctomycetota bacterium]